MRYGFAFVRVGVAVLIFAAILGQLLLSFDIWTRTGADIAFSVVNFFSFFTIESNVASVVVLLVGAVILVARRGDDPEWFTVMRVVVVTYMATTGVVYNLLLRGIELPQGTTLPWSNEVLHVVGPIYLVLDWLFAPGRTPVASRAMWWIVGFPIAWAAYTLIRGPFAVSSLTGMRWYPYPFLNPETSQNGYLSVAFYVALIAVVISLVGVGAIWISRRWDRGRPVDASAPAPAPVAAGSSAPGGATSGEPGGDASTPARR